uniref:4Fe-4S Mo/W bis-MGD-type domain-containing protein n=1 Tax=Romanomermis culicivorax TaxID=13658 RepID=A0A915K1D9_ROMCU
MHDDFDAQKSFLCQMPTVPSPPPQPATLNFQTAMSYGGPRNFPSPVTYNFKNGNNIGGNVQPPPPPLSANGGAMPFFAGQLLPLRFICSPPPPPPNSQQPPPLFCQCYAAALAANGNVLQNGGILMTNGPTICPACLMKCGAQYVE